MIYNVHLNFQKDVELVQAYSYTEACTKVLEKVLPLTGAESSTLFQEMINAGLNKSIAKEVI